jgi:hypothetical protein
VLGALVDRITELLQMALIAQLLVLPLQAVAEEGLTKIHILQVAAVLVVVLPQCVMEIALAAQELLVKETLEVLT